VDADSRVVLIVIQILRENHVAAGGAGRFNDRCIPVGQAITSGCFQSGLHEIRRYLLDRKAKDERLDKIRGLIVGERTVSGHSRGLDVKLLKNLGGDFQVAFIEQR